MAISNALLTTCRAAIILTPAYTAYTAAMSALDVANEPGKLAKWEAAYGHRDGGSLAMQLRVAIREVVRDQDLSLLSVLERESICGTLAGLYLRDDEKPLSPAEEAAQLASLLSAGIASN